LLRLIKTAFFVPLPTDRYETYRLRSCRATAGELLTRFGKLLAQQLATGKILLKLPLLDPM
jgi:hypothetical protein